MTLKAGERKTIRAPRHRIPEYDHADATVEVELKQGDKVLGTLRGVFNITSCGA